MIIRHFSVSLLYQKINRLDAMEKTIGMGGMSLVRCGLWALLAFSVGVSTAQVKQRVRLTVASPAADSTVSTDSLVYFRGMADPSGTLFLNGVPVPVYRTASLQRPFVCRPASTS